MGAVNQLLASTGLQVSASNSNNNINNNNTPNKIHLIIFFHTPYYNSNIKSNFFKYIFYK